MISDIVFLVLKISIFLMMLVYIQALFYLYMMTCKSWLLRQIPSLPQEDIEAIPLYSGIDTVHMWCTYIFTTVMCANSRPNWDQALWYATVDVFLGLEPKGTSPEEHKQIETTSNFLGQAKPHLTYGTDHRIPILYLLVSFIKLSKTTPIVSDKLICILSFTYGSTHYCFPVFSCAIQTAIHGSHFTCITSFNIQLRTCSVLQSCLTNPS
jgi:hypothetical protein